MTRHFGRMIASAWLICGGVAASSAASASYQHVLLISVDGMHAIDLANFVAAHPRSCRFPASTPFAMEPAAPVLVVAEALAEIGSCATVPMSVMSPRTSIVVSRFGSYAMPPGTRWLSAATVEITSSSVSPSEYELVRIDLHFVRRRNVAADARVGDAVDLFDARYDDVVRVE